MDGDGGLWGGGGLVLCAGGSGLRLLCCLYWCRIAVLLFTVIVFAL
jgi:hypothetical protein